MSYAEFSQKLYQQLETQGLGSLAELLRHRTFEWRILFDELEPDDSYIENMVDFLSLSRGLVDFETAFRVLERILFQAVANDLNYSIYEHDRVIGALQIFGSGFYTKPSFLRRSKSEWWANEENQQQLKTLQKTLEQFYQEFNSVTGMLEEAASYFDLHEYVVGLEKLISLFHQYSSLSEKLRKELSPSLQKDAAHCERAELKKMPRAIPLDDGRRYNDLLWKLQFAIQHLRQLSIYSESATDQSSDELAPLS